MSLVTEDITDCILQGTYMISDHNDLTSDLEQDMNPDDQEDQDIDPDLNDDTDCIMCGCTGITCGCTDMTQCVYYPRIEDKTDLETLRKDQEYGFYDGHDVDYRYQWLTEDEIATIRRNPVIERQIRESRPTEILTSDMLKYILGM